MAKNNFNFEKALEDLNTIVNEMEQGNLSLEESLLRFEKGMTLTRECQKALQTAEQKIEMLINKDGTLTLNDYLPDE